MEKVFIILKECDDPYYGDNAEIYMCEDIARKRLKVLYNQKHFGQLYEAKLIDNTGWNRFAF